MIDLHYIQLRSMTRNESAAGTEEPLGLFLGPDEIGAFPAPARGRCRASAVERTVHLEPASDAPLSLRVAGADAWGPREAIVAAQYSIGGGARRSAAVAIARPVRADASGADLVVSESAPDAVSSLALSRFRPGTETGLLDQFCLFLSTDRACAATRGPLELCVRVSMGGVPVVAFQTVLPKVGRDTPGEAGRYMYRFQLPEPGVPLALIHSVSIANRSDDAWGVAFGELYGWTVDGHGQPVGGLLSEGPRLQVVSQDLSCRFPEPANELQFQTGWHKNPTTDAYAFKLFGEPRALP